ncbi:MAG TPA: DUF4261 domain-containing protein [Terriglobales bacterium]|jgi:hypothetical protein|nr:DUF4261 domain-containing protein [Terriglobales bacterium]
MKGLFTQGVAILTAQPLALDELRSLLSEYRVLRTVKPGADWPLGGASALIDYREEINGLAQIDTVDHPWPDGMGDPKNDPTIFYAWSMGFFGPFAYPRGLKRATEQACSWPDAKTIVPRHRAFLRIRITYMAGPDAPVMPAGVDPLHELEFVTGLAQQLLKHPAALCYFNPNGEVVAPAFIFRDSVEYHQKHDLPPFDLWSNVRLFNLAPDWLLMDTVGLWQLDMPDHEAVFPKDHFNPSDVSKFLRNAPLYVMRGGREIKDNDTMDGPADAHWQAVRFLRPLVKPPREVFCWVPQGSQSIPKQITNRERVAEMSSRPS